MDAVSEMKLQIFSNQYYEFVERFVKTDFEDSKVLGKFYTNIEIAERMISDLLLQFNLAGNKIRVIDPFCGDGRLIRILLIQMACTPLYKDSEVEVFLWDVDENAVNSAGKAIQEMAANLPMKISVVAQKADAYVLYSSFEGTFDICVTNPPWGLLKPQKLFNSRCSQEDIEEYKKSIATYDDYMRNEFPLSQPTKKFGRWGTNLGRTGTEVALRLLNMNGLCGLVSPASLFNDQVSVPLREWIFNQHRILNISYYPAELKLYGSADVSSITVVLGKGKTDSTFETKIYDAEGQFSIKHLTENAFEYICRNQYSLPLESGFDTIDILQFLEHLPSVEQVCGITGLQFARELDETRVTEKLQSTGRIRFAKGYMVDRYSFQPEDQYLNEEKCIPPNSVDRWKLVWRDVSRNSQKRRMKATILPPGHIAGNSLGVIFASDENQIGRLKELLAIINSMVFEFQARSQLVSNHVAAGVIKQIRIPNLENDSYIVKLVDEQMNGTDNSWTLEAVVATKYGISFDQYITVVRGFDYTPEEIEEITMVARKVYEERTSA